MLANSGKVRIFAPVKTKQWSRSSTEESSWLRISRLQV